MATPQEQYLEVIRQSQQAVLDAVDSWSKTVQETTGSIPTAPPAVDPRQVVDQVFDFAEKLLDMQRDFTRSLLASSAAMSENVTRQSAQSAQSAQSPQSAQSAQSPQAAQTPRPEHRA